MNQKAVNGPHLSRAREGEVSLLALILELISHGNYIAGALLLQQSSIQQTLHTS